MANKITEEMLEVAYGMSDCVTNRWQINIKKQRVSIIKFRDKHYYGAYEIYSEDKLFDDVERYETMTKVLARLNELNKGGK